MIQIGKRLAQRARTARAQASAAADDVRLDELHRTIADLKAVRGYATYDPLVAPLIVPVVLALEAAVAEIMRRPRPRR